MSRGVRDETRLRRWIFTFHGIGTPPRPLENGEDAVWLDRGEFEAALDLLREHPEALITFDDGNASDFEIALPALLERGLRAEFFVCADLLDQPGYLSQLQLKSLAAEGMGIGSHGRRHCPWQGLRDEALEDEIVKARTEIEDALEDRIHHAACPFGAYDRRSLAALRAAGFERVYTSDGGDSRADAWLQPRNTAIRGSSVSAFRGLLTQPRARHDAWLRGAKTLVKRLR